MNILNYFIYGFLIELTLIVTIGMQNAFILRQSIKREHVIIAILTLTLVESSLLFAGTAGMGALLNIFPKASKIITIAGALFLIVYAIKSIVSAIRNTDMLEIEETNNKLKPLSIVVLALGFGYLNPHVVVDMTLMGSLAISNYPHQWEFFAGAAVGAFTWYVFLGLLGRFFAKKLSEPKVWKIVNIIIAILCLFMAYRFVGGLNGDPHDHEHPFEHIKTMIYE